MKSRFVFVCAIVLLCCSLLHAQSTNIVKPAVGVIYTLPLDKFVPNVTNYTVTITSISTGGYSANVVVQTSCGGKVETFSFAGCLLTDSDGMLTLYTNKYSCKTNRANPDQSVSLTDFTGDDLYRSFESIVYVYKYKPIKKVKAWSCSKS